MATTTPSLDTAERAELAASLRVVACAAATDRGTRRTVNEDAMLVAAPLPAVADGVGGQRAGEDASALALDVLRREVCAQTDDPEHELRRALLRANDAVRVAAGVGDGEAMATTVVAALVGSAMLTVAHVGDSRAYLLRDGCAEQITTDHSLVATLVADGTVDAATAPTHPMRAVILRAVGLDDAVAADVTTAPAQRDDIVVLCSDGLSDAVSADEIERLARIDEGDLDHLVEQLADAARDAGSGDDVTVVAARLG